MITMEVTEDARWLCEENARKSILPRGGNGWGGGAFAIPAWQLQQLPPFRWA